MDVEVENGYDSVDEMLNAGPQPAEAEDDSDFDPELDRRRYSLCEFELKGLRSVTISAAVLFIGRRA